MLTKKTEVFVFKIPEGRSVLAEKSQLRIFTFLGLRICAFHVTVYPSGPLLPKKSPFLTALRSGTGACKSPRRVHPPSPHVTRFIWNTAQDIRSYSHRDLVVNCITKRNDHYLLGVSKVSTKLKSWIAICATYAAPCSSCQYPRRKVFWIFENVQWMCSPRLQQRLCNEAWGMRWTEFERAFKFVKDL